MLAAGMLVVQLLMVVQRMLLTNIRLFALQSLMLTGIAGIIAYFHSATDVYLVAVLTLLGKVLFLPWLLNRLVLRYGGNHVYRKAAPLFLAFIVGEIGTMLVWGLVPAVRTLFFQ